MGDEFTLNSTTTNLQQAPAIAGLIDGGFAAAWQSYKGGYHIRVRVFDSDGSPVGPDFVSDTTGGTGAAVAALADGRFVVTWQSANGTDEDISGRLFNADGTPDGADFIVNTTTTADQGGPAVTALPDGRFVVTYESFDTGDGDIRAVILDPTMFAGTTSDDVWQGGDFADTITGGNGQDHLSGSGGDDIVSGDADNDVLSGGAGEDRLFGGTGGDTLDGGSGSDRMAGGAGNDTYVVDTAADQVIEGGNGGIDLVEASVSFTLPLNVENLTLTGTAAINGTGNAAANTIIGNSGANVLNGGAGPDTLEGGAGDDIYIVDSAGDQVVEAANGGTDIVESAISYVLGANVEKLILTGTALIGGTGNASANTIVGNGSGNILAGGAGNDLLNGGGGADTLEGGAGDDIYVIDNAGDRVVEAASQGTDLVDSSVSFVLPDNVENLALTGSASINGTGNALANVILGNAAANLLNGGGGADTLDGGAGKDTLDGGGGGDNFRFDAGLAKANVDHIVDFRPGTDQIELSHSVFTALARGALPNSAFFAATKAHDGNDHILYDSQSGALFYDQDGSHAAHAPIEFAVLAGHPALSAADFLVV